MYDVPVLLVAFNRPERLAALISELREIRPARVYVAVDGPRRDVPGEKERVLATRAEVAAIDWPADVRTLYREENLGCGRGVSGAIDWLFAHEERGIVLEDDILPDPSFFPFCAELLDRYQDDPRVWAISGCNFVPARHLSGFASYRFTSVPHIWGWATWRRAWDDYRFDASHWRKRLDLLSLRRAAGSTMGAAYWAAMFELAARGAVDTWDFQAALTAMSEGGLTATANVNLVENVGFGSGSTHTQARPGYVRPVETMAFPLVHPPEVIVDSRSEDWTRRTVFEATPQGLAAQALRFARRSILDRSR